MGSDRSNRLLCAFSSTLLRRMPTSSPRLEEAEAIAVVEGNGLAVDLDAIAGHAGDAPERLPDVFRAARRVDAWLSAMEEVVGAAPVETLLGIRRKGVAATTGGSGHQIGAARQDGVQLLAIPGGDVLDVVEPLRRPSILKERIPAAISASRLSV